MYGERRARSHHGWYEYPALRRSPVTCRSHANALRPARRERATGAQCDAMPLQPEPTMTASDRDGPKPMMTEHALPEEAPLMPDISLPEVHLPDFRLPEGLRDMNREDIQKAMPDVRLPKIDLPKRFDVSKEISKAAREADKALPRRSAPSPLPFVFF